MSNHQPTILVVDDEPLNLEIISEYLDDCGYSLVKAMNGEEALSILDNSEAEDFDLVLLDRMMPGIDGIEVLKQIKQNKKWQILPVILQTAATTPEQIAEGLQHGAFYYLPKPFEQQVLQAVVATALRDRISRLTILKELVTTSESLRMLQSGEFSFSTTSEARALGGLLAQLCPTPDTACLGLTELLLNAVEHGNLAISYDEKTKLLSDNQLQNEISIRLTLPEYASRQVKVKFLQSDQELIFMIQDQGNGFEWQRYLEIDMNRLLHNHGRGIAMSKKLSFSSLEYFGNGNSVKATIKR